MILLIDKVGIQQKEDPSNSNENTNVVLLNIRDGVDGASAFGFTAEPDEIIISKGETYVPSVSMSMNIATLKPVGDAYTGKTKIDQLEEWAINKEDVYISALTLDGFILMGDIHSSFAPIKITVNENLTSNDVLSVKSSRKSNLGYDTSTSVYQGGVYAGKNALSIYDWADADSSGLADGWTGAGFNSSTFSSGQQNLESPDSSSLFYKDVSLPFDSQRYNFSINFDSVGANIDTLKIRLQFRDASGSVLQNSDQDVSSTGRFSVTGLSPSGTSVVRVTIQSIATIGNTLSFTVSDPALRIDGESTYTKF